MRRDVLFIAALYHFRNPLLGLEKADILCSPLRQFLTRRAVRHMSALPCSHQPVETRPTPRRVRGVEHLETFLPASAENEVVRTQVRHLIVIEIIHQCDGPTPEIHEIDDNIIAVCGHGHPRSDVPEV